MTATTQTVAPVPKPVRKALRASGAPFRPVGTAVLFPQHTERPDIVVIWRKGCDPKAEIAVALRLARRKRSRVYVTFQSRRTWDEWHRKMAFGVN